MQAQAVAWAAPNQHLPRITTASTAPVRAEAIQSGVELPQSERARHMMNFTNFKSLAVSGFLSVTVLALATPALLKADNTKEQDRVTESGGVIKDLTNSANGIPTSLLNKFECVIILPSVKKAGFIVGASYGRGVVSCRKGANFDGAWSAPVMMQSTGGSFGLEAGGQATDFVILVLNDKGARALLKGKLKLGADASIAAGPVGRDAEASTNASIRAEMLSYSRAQGVFQESPWLDQHWVPTAERMRISMERRFPPSKSSKAKFRRRTRRRNYWPSSQRTPKNVSAGK